MKTLYYSILLSLITVISFLQKTKEQNRKDQKNYESPTKTEVSTAQENHKSYDHLEIKEKGKQQKLE